MRFFYKYLIYVIFLYFEIFNLSYLKLWNRVLIFHKTILRQ